MCIIDRFEGNWAIIETDDRQTFNLPRSLLPSGTKEGDVISISVSINKDETEARHHRINRLMKDFFDE